MEAPSCSSSTSSAKLEDRRECYFDAPADHGLLISLDGSTGACRLQFVKDQHWDSIHPHVHLPASLQSVEKLGGGGSGATILRAVDAEFGDVVLKHGGHKETRDVFALAKVKEELNARGRNGDLASAAVSDMVTRIPEFRFLYVSRANLWDRGEELWSLLRNSVLECDEIQDVHRRVVRRMAQQKDIRIYNRRSQEGTSKLAAVQDGRLEVVLDKSADFELDENGMKRVSADGKGFAYLQRCMRDLIAVQKERMWKFEVAQKAIGGPKPKTAAALLATGRLHGEMLEALITRMLRVIHNLQCLTNAEETDVVSHVRRELLALDERAGPADVSELADAYVGFAIRKNFHPSSGRFNRLRSLGDLFRSNAAVLTEAEQVPALCLGRLLRPGARPTEVFVAAGGQTALDAWCNDWRSLLEHAASLEEPVALGRVWTSGLSDCGLHNLFLTEDQLWLFDLGEPAFMALPAFLTKFLMSFFHTLGMEEAGASGDWVNRFEPAGDLVRPTDVTARLLQSTHNAFDTVLGRLVEEVFSGNPSVRELLLKYVVLQLLSDAGFCLERWQVKGGGAHRWGPPQALEKWLWRTLWDLYVAGEVMGRHFPAVASEPCNHTGMLGGHK